MRVYEELFILKPDVPEEEVTAYIDQLKHIITDGKGTIEKIDNWGIRKLAYRVAKLNEGRYVLIQFSSGPELVHELERRMRVNDQVIKFITVRIDERMKKIEKRKKARDKRAARRPPPPTLSAPAAPAAPLAPLMPAEPATAAPGAPVTAAPATSVTPVTAVTTAPLAPAAAAVETKES